jgi:hypothetical protein
MGALAGDLDDLGPGRETCAICGPRQRGAHGIRYGLPHRPAALADEEHQDAAVAMLVRAGDESVSALDAMGEALLQKEVQGAVDRDRGGAVSLAVLEPLDQLVGTDRRMRARQSLEDLAANGRQARPALGADPLGTGERRLGAMRVVVTGRGKEAVMVGSVVVMIAHGVNLAMATMRFQASRFRTARFLRLAGDS